MVTLQLPVPVQAPLQPLNTEVVSGDAVNVITCPVVKGDEQSAPQSTPAGLEVTRPSPTPVRVTFMGKVLLVKEALAVFAASIVTVHVPVPLQAPDQPLNWEVLSGVAVNVIVVAPSYDALQVGPQEIPAGVVVTAPAPLPDFVTVTGAVNRAETDLGASMVTVQPPVPVQAPLQPEKVNPVSGRTVSITELPDGNDAEQFDPQ